MDERVVKAIRSCKLRSGVSNEELSKLAAHLGVALPPDYIELMAFTNGFTGFVGENFVNISSIEEVHKHGLYEGWPFLVFIGLDGGGEGFAYDMRVDPPSLIHVPFIVIEERLIRVLGHSILEFLERLERAPLFP